MKELWTFFYNECKSEVKTYKGYVLVAVDGRDFEIPNTKTTKKEYSGLMKNEEGNRTTVSAMFDVFNGYVIDTLIKPYRTSEIEMEKEHLKKFKKDNKRIEINKSIEDFYYSNKNNEKYITRLQDKEKRKITIIVICLF